MVRWLGSSSWGHLSLCTADKYGWLSIGAARLTYICSTEKHMFCTGAECSCQSCCVEGAEMGWLCWVLFSVLRSMNYDPIYFFFLSAFGNFLLLFRWCCGESTERFCQQILGAHRLLFICKDLCLSNQMLPVPVLLHGILNIIRTFFCNLAVISHLHLLEDVMPVLCILKYRQL